jgi:thymidylate synthase ThyX
MNRISAKIVADSLSPMGRRLTTFELIYPRMIHGEMMTHRVFSRNSASSRAIPFRKMVKEVEENPFAPIAWQKDHRGMQGTEYLEDGCLTEEWLMARDKAIEQAKVIHGYGVTKQLCNRLLEPFMWHKVLVTASEWENFFALRCPQYRVGGKGNEVQCSGLYRSKKDAIKDYPGAADEPVINWLHWSESQAEIHIQAIAEAMWDAMNESTPKELKKGEWHIPYGDNIDDIELDKLFKPGKPPMNRIEAKLNIATARCARVSYQTLGDNAKIDYEADIRLHDNLLASGHMSPFEHCARAMSALEYSQFSATAPTARDYEQNGVIVPAGADVDIQEGWCRNFRGFIQYRHLIETI